MTGSELDIEVESDDDDDGVPDKAARLTVSVSNPNGHPHDAGMNGTVSSAPRIALRSAPYTPVDPLEEG